MLIRRNRKYIRCSASVVEEAEHFFIFIEDYKNTSIKSAFYINLSNFKINYIYFNVDIWKIK